MRISRMVAVGGIASMLALAGCTSTPDEPLPVPTSAPSTTPTPEYTPGLDAEADVEAAIKTYEAYVEASNNLVIADRETWDPVLELTTGEMHSASERSFQQMEADGRSLTGLARVMSADLAGTEPRLIVLDTCLDVSNTDVVNEDGLSVLDPERAHVSWLRVRLITSEEAATPWQIEHIAFRDDGPPC